MYGLKQAEHNWYHVIHKGLEKLRFVPSIIDECAFYNEGVVIRIYMHDYIIFGDTYK